MSPLCRHIRQPNIMKMPSLPDVTIDWENLGFSYQRTHCHSVDGKDFEDRDDGKEIINYELLILFCLSLSLSLSQL